MILAVRHIWTDQVNGKEPIHKDLVDAFKQVVGMLHSACLALPRGAMGMVSKLAESKGKLSQFNTNQRGVWTAEFDTSSGKLQYPTFHGPTARKLIEMYTACIDRDEASDTFTLRDMDTWPLKGIVDDNDPNLHHILALFCWLNKEMVLAQKLFLTPAELSSLFQVTLEVTIRLVAVSVFGCGFPLYAHFHLHAPWQLLFGLLQGWRFVGEDVCEAMHITWKALSLHTTRGGARGRLGKGSNAEAVPLASREQRVISGDLHAVHQMVRRYMAYLIATHKEALDWWDTMQRDHPTVEVYTNTSGQAHARVHVCTQACTHEHATHERVRAHTRMHA